jgi:hypothetical protein
MPFDARAASCWKRVDTLPLTVVLGYALNRQIVHGHGVSLQKSGRREDAPSQDSQLAAMSPVKAHVKWENLKEMRDGGVAPAKEKRAARSAEVAAIAVKKASSASGRLTVKKVCAGYWEGPC